MFLLDSQELRNRKWLRIKGHYILSIDYGNRVTIRSSSEAESKILKQSTDLKCKSGALIMKYLRHDLEDHKFPVNLGSGG